MCEAASQWLRDKRSEHQVLRERVYGLKSELANATREIGDWWKTALGNLMEQFEENLAEGYHPQVIVIEMWLGAASQCCMVACTRLHAVAWQVMFRLTGRHALLSNTCYCARHIVEPVAALGLLISSE